MKTNVGLGYLIGLSVLISATSTATTVRAMPPVDCHFLIEECGWGGGAGSGFGSGDAGGGSEPVPDPDDATRDAQKDARDAASNRPPVDSDQPHPTSPTRGHAVIGHPGTVDDGYPLVCNRKPALPQCN